MLWITWGELDGINYTSHLTVESTRIPASLAPALNGYKSHYAVEVGLEGDVRIFDVHEVGSYWVVDYEYVGGLNIIVCRPH
jgi:hypothetical protein